MLIYEAFNKNNGKVYVGLTTKTLEVRKASHLRSAKANSKAYFHKAIRKHGEEAFEWYRILTTGSLEELYKLEKLAISLYEPWQTYNCSLGGEHSAYGMRHSQETKDVCGRHALQRWEGARAKDIYPEWVFELSSYKEARKFHVPKTTWYRYRKTGIT